MLACWAAPATGTHQRQVGRNKSAGAVLFVGHNPTPMRLAMIMLAGWAAVDCTHGSELSAELTHSRYRMRETLPQGIVFSEDRGTVPGLRLGWRSTREDGALSIKMWHQSAVVDYSGRNQLLLPISSRTDLRFDQIDLAWQWSWAAAPLEGVLGAGLQAHRLERGIRASTLSLPATEVLRSTALMLTVGLHGAAGPDHWRLIAGAGWPLDQQLVVDTADVVPRHALRPAARPRVELSLQSEWPVTPCWALQLTTEWGQVRNGPAPQQVLMRDGRVVGVSSYPGAVQHWHALALGMVARC